MTNFGFTGYDQVIFLGTNGKMSEVSAAMGITNLESLGDFIERNYQNYKQYQNGLRGLPGVKQVKYDETEKNNYQYITIEIDNAVAGVSRDQIAQILYRENVLARRYFYPGCHQMEPYASYFPHAGLLLPETEKLTQRTLCLPTGTAIDSDAIQRICQIINLCVFAGAKLSNRLAGTS
jgi:dTDP-4-amino-4,6-dideoxygalactose transaminase